MHALDHAHVHDAPSPSRDPTGTRPVRRSLETSASRRWRLLELATRDVVVDRDAFGFRPGSPTVLDSDGKLRAFEAWFDSSIRSIVVGDGTWFAGHVVRGYTMGQRRGEKIASVPSAASVSTLRVVIEAARSDFQGIAAAVTQQVVRAAAAVIVAKLPPSQLYRSVLDVIRRVGVVRTRLFSSYVVVRAHAAGTLDALESAGVVSVGLEVEGVPVIRVGDLRPMGPGRAKKKLRTRTKRPVRSGRRRAAIERAEQKLEKLRRVHVQTAGDDEVCPICEAIEEEGPYTIDQARNLIPAHPNCRCAFVSAAQKKVKDAFDPGQRRVPKGSPTGGRWTRTGSGRPTGSNRAGEDIDLIASARTIQTGERWSGTLYRGTGGGDDRKIPSQYAEGEHLAPTREHAETYGPDVEARRVTLENPRVFELPNKQPYKVELRKEFGTDDPREISAQLRADGRDALVVLNVPLQRSGVGGLAAEIILIGKKRVAKDHTPGGHEHDPKKKHGQRSADRPDEEE